MRRRRRARHDACVRAIVELEIALFGRVLSASIQDDCKPHQPDTFVQMFKHPDKDGRRGRHYTACSRCRVVLTLGPSS